VIQAEVCFSGLQDFSEVIAAITPNADQKQRQESANFYSKAASSDSKSSPQIAIKAPQPNFRTPTAAKGIPISAFTPNLAILKSAQTNDGVSSYRG